MEAKYPYPKIIAVDFDGCICKNAYPNIGEPNQPVIDALIEEKKRGTKLILWTCRVDQKLYEAVSWCAERGLEFDIVNRNLPDVIRSFGQDTRKIYADEYWDDRAVRVPLRGCYC